MSEIFGFKRFAGSGKGLRCRPMLGNDTYAKLSTIASINYSVFCVTDNVETTPSTSLTVADVMLEIPAKWSKDPIGYTFIWNAPGSLWPEPLKEYRIKVVYTPKDGAGNPDPAAAFMEVWKCETLDPNI